MYQNLKMVMSRKKITIKQLAELLNSREATVSDKINGNVGCGFYFDEALRIKNVFFGEYNLEWLFEKEEKVA